jgi:hypothetical protein
MYNSFLNNKFSWTFPHPNPNLLTTNLQEECVYAFKKFLFQIRTQQQHVQGKCLNYFTTKELLEIMKFIWYNLGIFKNKENLIQYFRLWKLVLFYTRREI